MTKKLLNIIVGSPDYEPTVDDLVNILEVFTEVVNNNEDLVIAANSYSVKVEVLEVQDVNEVKVSAFENKNNFNGILKFITKHDACTDDILFWNEKLEFFFICNDLFAWACADMEKVTDENLPDIEQAYIDCKNLCNWDSSNILDYSIILYCCRARKLRPQKPYYKHIPKVLHELFDACGQEPIQNQEL